MADSTNASKRDSSCVDEIHKDNSTAGHCSKKLRSGGDAMGSTHDACDPVTDAEPVSSSQVVAPEVKQGVVSKKEAELDREVKSQEEDGKAGDREETEVESETLVGEREGAQQSGGDTSGTTKRRPPKNQVLVGLRETDVGIVEFMSQHKGVPGILKQRYRDFIVNEIAEDGSIVRLTDTKCPEKKSILNFDYNEVLSAEDQDKLAALNTAKEKGAEYMIEVTEDKEQRTKVHQAIRHLYPKLESSTVENGERKMVRVIKGSGGSRGKRWPKDTPKYCKFVLYKENMDLNEALSIIAKYLHIAPHNFQYAGSKDKRGVTTQEVTVHRVDGERLAQLNKVLKCIRLGNFRYANKQLSLGELTGNHFVIILRMVKETKEHIDVAMASLRDAGFINYFGMQRFGNSLISTYHVGRALLLSQWQNAVDLILKPREGTQEDNRWRRHWMETRDAKSTLERLPYHKKSSVEQQLLTGLLKSRNDYMAAFSSIPRNTRFIYLHSYQSYIWNVVTTKRLQQDGMSPIVGDLVATEEKEGDSLDTCRVEYVTEDNKAGFTIYDVVLPLPGHGIKFPTHHAGQLYKEKLSEDGLTVEMLKNPNRDLSLFGAYRKCVVKPTDVDWKLYHYEDVKVPLVLTDLEKLENKQEMDTPSEGSHTALQVEFSLPRSCYATMALREVMKADTSAVHQSSLNNT